MGVWGRLRGAVGLNARKRERVATKCAGPSTLLRTNGERGGGLPRSGLADAGVKGQSKYVQTNGATDTLWWTNAMLGSFTDG